MANEIRFTGSIVTTATNFSETISPGQISIDLPSGPDLTSESGVQATTTAAGGDALTVGNLTSSKDGGIYFFRNLGTATGDNIEIGATLGGSFEAFILLKPGEYAMGRLPSSYPAANALKIRSVANTPALQYKIYAGDL